MQALLLQAGISLVSSIIVFTISNVFYANYKEKRRNKEFVFSILMQSRGMIDKEKIRALNLIQVVFQKDKAVLDAWKSYHNSLKSDKDTPTQQELEASKKLELKMLEEMAKKLKYKKVTWDIIDDSYYPRWLVAEQENTENYAKTVKGVANMLPGMQKMVSGGSSPKPGKK